MGFFIKKQLISVEFKFLKGTKGRLKDDHGFFNFSVQGLVVSSAENAFFSSRVQSSWGQRRKRWRTRWRPRRIW